MKKLEVFTSQGGARYVRAPRAEVVAETKFDVELGIAGMRELFNDESAGIVDYGEMDYEAGSETLSQFAGQLSYLSFGEKRTPLAENKKYLERIMESAHGSVFEHSSYSVLFFGIDRATTHELVRHRAGTAFSQVSQRYVDDEHLRFVMPYEYNGSSKLIAQFERRIDKAVEDYRITSHELREVIKRNDGESSTEYRKRIQSCSREVLPNCTEAPIIVTANVRAWRHIFSMRCSAHADVRIRRPMIEVLQSLRLKAPNLFSDFEFEQLRDGTLAAASRYPKV